jgi:hypothetical protein
MQKFKTITKEERIIDTVTCNGCGEVSEDYNEIKIIGHYNSKLLTDMNSYSFDLCEACMVKIMDNLKIPPTVFSNYDIDYTTDRKRRNEQVAEQVTRDNLYNDAIARGICPWIVGENEICGGAAEGMIDGVATCARCLIDEEHTPVDIARKDKFGNLIHMTLKERKEIGLRYLKEVREGKHPEVIGPHDLAIYISTAISMLITDTTIASAELHRLTNQWPKSKKEWIHYRIPTAFDSNDDCAKIANEWLAWAQEAGYRNAAANVMLGNSPEQYWSYYGN